MNNTTEKRRRAFADWMAWIDWNTQRRERNALVIPDAVHHIRLRTLVTRYRVARAQDDNRWWVPVGSSG